MKAKTDWFQLIITALIFFSIGAFVGYVIKIWPVKIVNEVTIGQIPSFFLPILIALYIPFYLSKRINNRRVEKDILIAGCNKQEEELQELRKLIDQAYLRPDRIKKQLARNIVLKTKRIRKSLSLLDKSLSKYKSLLGIKAVIKQLEYNQIDCWENLTFHLFDSTPKFTEDKFAAADENLYEFSENLTKLKLLINEI